MAETYYSIKLSTLTEIGDAIRAKNGATGDIAVTSLATSILDRSPADGAEEWDGTGVVIAPITPEASPSITIDGATYNVIKGMTWFTWASNEEYNTDNFQCLTVDSKVFVAEREDYVIDSEGNAVYGGDLITVGGVYSIEEATTDELAGTWVFNDVLTVPPSTNIWSFSFTSNNIQMIRLEFTAFDWADYEYSMAYFSGSQEYPVYIMDSNGWLDEAYKTITITSKLSEVTNGSTLLTWLKANATKQGAASLITFTIGGTEYQAEDGMTWAEWVESDYNTNGYTKNSDNLIISSGGAAVVNSSYETVQASYEIISGSAYKLSQGGGA